MPTTSQGSFAIRRLRPSEMALVNHLALASLWNVELPDRSLQEIEGLLQRVPTPARAFAEGGSYFVAEIAGVIAAGGGWASMATDERARGPILSPLFFIDPGEAARGLRAALLDCIEADIADAGHRQAYAIVAARSAADYEALGYEVVGPPQAAYPRLPLARLRKVVAAELAAVA